MTTTLFTATTSHIAATDRDDAIGILCDALHAEFPAYYVSSWTKADFATAIFVTGMDADVPIPAHINGWGTDELTLKLVA